RGRSTTSTAACVKGSPRRRPCAVSSATSPERCSPTYLANDWLDSPRSITMCACARRHLVTRRCGEEPKTERLVIVRVREMRYHLPGVPEEQAQQIATAMQRP